ncbi:MAG: response regulator [Chloroflexia bacterium]
MMKTILIVDDDVAILELLKDILSEEGYQTVCAGDGLKALHVVDEADVDLVISDINMPNLNGAELVTVLRQRPKTKKTPVLALTSLPEMRRSTDKSFAAILHKPFKLEELVETVKMLLYPRMTS